MGTIFRHTYRSFSPGRFDLDVLDPELWKTLELLHMCDISLRFTKTRIKNILQKKSNTIDVYICKLI